jgi:hypothetical protein
MTNHLAFIFRNCSQLSVHSGQLGTFWISISTLPYLLFFNREQLQKVRHFRLPDHLNGYAILRNPCAISVPQTINLVPQGTISLCEKHK